MPCEKCGGELVYVGEHWNDDEGYCSTYVCKKCYPKLVRKYKNRYNSHLYKCNNEFCQRCGGDGYKKKHDGGVNAVGVSAH